MAHTLVSIVTEKLRHPFVSMAMKKLGEEVKLVGGAQAELGKLSSTFQSIEAVLNHAETLQITNESVRVWLEKLKDVAYDMDDVLDELILSAEEPEPGTVWASLFSLFLCCGLEDWIRLAHESWTNGNQTDDGGIRDRMRTFLSKVASQRDLAHQIKEIKERLDQIEDEKNKYSFKENSSGGGSEREKAVYQTSSLVDESQMLGRDEDKNIIISKLVSGSSCEEGRIQVISIIGVGGLGKTTLARLIFNDERVRSHFQKVLWVCVSDDFDLVRVTKAIIEDAEEKSSQLSQLNSLQEQLLQTLRDKLFLLVLDDVWNDDSDRWEQLWLSFQSGAPRSKILVTTRSEKVATTCSPSAYMHPLKGLSDDDCWSLFKSKAFARREMEDPLKEIGKKIVNKCKGVPLSAKVMGSAMRSKRTDQDWENILKSETWEIPDIAKGILPALLLSYYNLPVHLKQCFAYCSMFPKDHVLEKDRLVKLWLAQGFIKPQGRREIEAIGGEYFDELLARSLLQAVEEDDRGYVTYIMHDLLHDLAQFITKNECCIFEMGKSDSSSVTARHSSFILTRETSHIPAPLCDAKKLRTLLLIGGYSVIDTIPDNLFRCARSLRTLDFSGHVGGTRIKELPSSIELLKHLRYLDLSDSKIVELPESVSSLRNLQTLKLNKCEKLQRLPSGMSAMVDLRHLEIDDTGALKYLPKGLGRISSLQTLSKFIVGSYGECEIGELKYLNSLQGKLKIIHLERVCWGDEATGAELEKKSHLRVLSLSMSGDGYVERMENVLEALRPPVANLEEIEISGYNGSKFPAWLGDSSFSNLVKLRLSGCYGCTQLPGLGRLPSLKHLEIVGGLIKRVGQEFYGNSCGGGINGAAFPKLEYLYFYYMNELEDWELRLEDREIMPSLRNLIVYDCPKLKALPQHLPKSLKSLSIQKCGEISGMRCSLPLVEQFEVNSSGGILWPLPNLPRLKAFVICLLKNTTCLPDDGWKQLESLERLTIRDCYKLRSLPDELGQLKSLKSLKINNCPELRSLPQVLWEQLESLENLFISYCSKLRSLPDELGQLKSLKSLAINNCPELRSLPQVLWGLTCLQYLNISGNPMLVDIFTGKDWSKISHIPNIWIDYHKIK